jgi:hypothetical protein
MEFLTSVLDGSVWSSFMLQLLYPREKAPGTHWIGDWVELRTSLNAVEKRTIPLSQSSRHFTD